MLLAYVDESGNTGDASSGGSLTYALGCVLIDADLWPTAFDEIVEFRRRLRIEFAVPTRAEIKANYLLRNSGPLRDIALGPGARRVIYRAHLRLVSELPARAFAIVIDKRDKSLPPSGVFDMAWEMLLQRLERTSTKESQTFMLIHDEGENDAVRRWVRRARRYLPAPSAYGGSSLKRSASLLVDDPVPRRSEQGYFIQLADLVAYASFRSVISPSAAIARVCPQETWMELGDAIHRPVAALRPYAAPGIVLR